MNKYKELYFFLFNAVSDALQAQAEQNYGTAQKILVCAQQSCEEKYISDKKDG